MKTLIKNVTILTMEEATPLQNSAVVIQDGRILSVGAAPADFVGEVIDGGGNYLMPGLHNAHTHVPMSLMRGYGDGHNLQDWLHHYIFPVEARWDDRSMRAGAALSLAEMIASGTTGIVDMYMRIDNIAALCAEVGMNANLTNGITEFEDFDAKTNNGMREIEDALAKWHGHDNGRIQVDAGIHAEYTNKRASCEHLGRFAVDNGLNVHVHVSETKREHDECVAKYGMTPMAFLDSCGLFEAKRSIAAHCVYATEADMEIMKAKHITAAHNPISNLKLGSGIAPMSMWLDSGINIALGTDGVSSNNSHDMFDDLKFAGILHKGATRDPLLLPAFETLKMATVNGGIATGRQTGKIAPGYWADMIMLRAGDLNLIPCHDLCSNLVYAACGGNVCMNMVHGRIIYRDGEFLTLDIKDVLREVREYALPHLYGKG